MRLEIIIFLYGSSIQVYGPYIYRNVFFFFSKIIGNIIYSYIMQIRLHYTQILRAAITYVEYRYWVHVIFFRVNCRNIIYYIICVRPFSRGNRTVYLLEKYDHLGTVFDGVFNKANRTYIIFYHVIPCVYTYIRIYKYTSKQICPCVYMRIYHIQVLHALVQYK